MRFRRFSRTILFLAVLLLPLGFVLLQGIRSARKLYATAEQNLAPILAAEISRSVGRPVTVEKVIIEGGSIFVDGVRIAERSGFMRPDSPAFASADRVALELDFRRILFERNPDIPMFPEARVIRPVARVVRDARGQWNFEDITRRPRPPARRRAVGVVRFEDGLAVLEDQSFYRHPTRPSMPLRAIAASLDGSVQFNLDQSTTVTVEGVERTGLVRSFSGIGGYDSRRQRLYVRVMVDRAFLPVGARLLPRRYEVLSGYGSGQMTLLRQPDGAGGWINDYQADVRVEDASIRPPQLASAVRQIQGAATITNDVVTARADAQFAGSPIHAEGTLFLQQEPAFQGWATGRGLQLDRVLAALRLGDRYPALRTVTASANLRADVSGTANRLDLRAAGTGRGGGALPGGVTTALSDEIQLTFSGTLKSPAVIASGRIPRARFRNFEVRDIQLAGVFGPERIAADFGGTIAGGRITGRANVSPAGNRTTYAVTARARGVDLARLPLPGKTRARGVASVDLSAHGRLDQTLPQGAAEIQVRRPGYGPYQADTATARLTTRGNLVQVERLIAFAGTGLAVGRGRIDVRRKTLDLQMEANDINLASLPVARTPEGEQRLRGHVYLRDGQITGPWDNPQISGVVRGYGILVGDRLRLDYADARISGSMERLQIDQGRIYRFPEYTTFAGVITRPTQPDARLSLEGRFVGVDLEDIAALVGTQLEASGTAVGAWQATGSIANPVVVVRDIDVANPSLNQVFFERLTGEITYDARGREPALTFRNLALTYSRAGDAGKPDVILRGSGTLRGREVQAQVSAEDVPLELVDPIALAYARIRGRADVSASVRATLQEAGGLEDITGQVRAETKELRINDQDFGNLTATAGVGRERVTGTVYPSGPSEVPVDARPGLHVTEFAYNFEEQALRAVGALRRVEIETLRQASVRSPFAITNAQNPAVKYLSSLSRPFAGALDVEFQVGGPLSDPDGKVRWTGRSMEIEGQPIQRFEGRGSFDRRVVVIDSATLVADETVVTVEGSYAPRGSVRAEVVLSSLPLRIVHTWLPEQQKLQGLSGMVDNITINVEGVARNPTLTASADLSNIVWQDPEPDPSKKILAHPIELPLVRVSTVRIAEGKLTVGDVGLRIREPERALPKRPAEMVLRAPAGGVDPSTATPEAVERSLPQLAPVPPQPRQTFEAHASAAVDFAWEPPFIPDDARADVRVSVRNQGLALISAFMPEARVTLNGQIEEASLRYVGSLANLRDPQAAVGDPDVRLTGRVAVKADRIASAAASTELRDLNMDVLFEGDSVVVRQLTARTQVVHPNFASSKSDEIRVEGQLPVSAPAPSAGLRITAPKVVFAESPLPGLASGAAAGELSTDDRETPAVEWLAVTGTLFNPLVSGNVRIWNTFFRMPDAFPERAPTPPPLPVLPRFDLRFIAERGVRFSSSAMNAELRTSPTEPVALSGEIGDIRLAGTLLIDRGTMVFPTARFTIERNSEVELRYPYVPAGDVEPTLGILLDVTATTRLRMTSDLTAERKRYTVTVEARGPLNSGEPLQITDPGALTGEAAGGRGLRLTFRTDPADLAATSAGVQRKITAALGGQEQIASLMSGRFNVGEFLPGFVSDIFLPELLERTGIARALGFEELEIESNRLDAFSIRLSRQLFGPIYASYWRRLSGVNDPASGALGSWEFKLSYRVRPNLQFSWTSNEQRTNNVLLEGIFRF